MTSSSDDHGQYHDTDSLSNFREVSDALTPERVVAELSSVTLEDGSNSGGGGEGGNGGLTWSFAMDIGKREEMEDKIVINPNFMTMPCSAFGGCNSPEIHTAGRDTKIHYFALFDGHGGSQVSNYCASKLHDIVAQEWEMEEDSGDEWTKKWKVVLSKGFSNADDAFKDGILAPRNVGSTALVVIVSACQILASNCGDCRAVLCRGNKVIPLTSDHKPNRKDEAERIMNKGGRIMYWQGERVEGVLAVTRSIGDHYLKQWIISEPELTCTTRCEEDEFLVLASDGLWDVLSNKEVAKLVRVLMKKKHRETGASSLETKSIASSLLNVALRSGSQDNISIIIVDLKSRTH